jgi:hypothetical protein
MITLALVPHREAIAAQVASLRSARTANPAAILDIGVFWMLAIIAIICAGQALYDGARARRLGKSSVSALSPALPNH